MTVLQGALPDSLLIGGEIFPIFTDFRNWMQIEIIMHEESGSFLEKIPKLLKLCYAKLPQSMEEALHAMALFYMGKEDDKRGVRENRKSRRLYSFRQDAELIYAAFYQQYGMDLSDACLHWWQFRALFAGLGKETRFIQVVSYRAMDLSQIKNAAEKKFYQRMKARYALQDVRSREEREADLAASLEQIF